METFNENSLPLVKKNITLNGIELTLVTHQQDQVHGSMFRGEFPLCPSYLAELEVLQSAIKPDYQVIDAGANIGSVAIVLAKTEPSATIYCFEPDEVNFALLNMNIALNGIHNIKPFNYALGKKQELIDLYLSKTNFGDHRSVKTSKNALNENSFDISANKVLKVNPYQFLKETLSLTEPGFIDLIKIDTQGADLEILEACIPLLKKDALVAIEYSPYHLDINGTTKEDIATILSCFSAIQKINPLGDQPRLSNIDISALFTFYDQQYQHYHTEYDLLLRSR
jgi:FkbM family methyltransferase